MKAKLTILTLALFIISSYGYSQFSFGVSPGLGLNTAYFGYKVSEKIVPYIGFQYMNANFSFTESGERYNWELDQVTSFENENEFSGSLYIPNIGVKYFFKEKNKLKAYSSINISKPMVGGKMKYDGDEDEYFKEQVDNLSMWGGELGFGMEYFFDKNFSIGGEFGIRYLHLKYEETWDEQIYDSNTGGYQESEIENTFKLNVSPTFSKISLNYYM